MDDGERALYSLFLGGALPLCDQPGELVRAGRIEHDIEPGGTGGRAGLAALAVAFGNGQLGTRAAGPADRPFFLLHDGLSR